MSLCGIYLYRHPKVSHEINCSKKFERVNFLVNFAVDNDATMANREIKFYKRYFNEFFTSQNEQTRRKIAQTLVWLREVDRLPVSILRSVEGRKGLYEIRIEVGNNIFRIFCCFDKGNLVILFNGFQKKTQKIPAKELDKAEKLMNEYFSEK
jgi:phage-related protein